MTESTFDHSANWDQSEVIFTYVHNAHVKSRSTTFQDNIVKLIPMCRLIIRYVAPVSRSPPYDEEVPGTTGTI